MADSDRCTAVNKRILENTFMYTYCIKNGLQTTVLAFRVVFQRFSMMKDNVHYKKPLSYEGWNLYVLKKRKAVFLTLCTFRKCMYDVRCCVRYGFNSTSKSVSASKVSGDEYLIKLSTEIIHDPKNEFIKQGYLFCEIDFVPRDCSTIVRPMVESRIHRKLRKDNSSSLYPNEMSEDTEEELLMKDIKVSLYVDFSDFKINLKDSIANVNKSIIAARSKFFFDYLKENPDAEEMDLDTSLDVLSVMLQYMYYGTFFAQPLEIMLAVIQLAKNLQMKRLREICTSSVKLSIDATNVHLIKETGLNIGEDELVSAADEFLAPNKSM